MYFCDHQYSRMNAFLMVPTFHCCTPESPRCGCRALATNQVKMCIIHTYSSFETMLLLLCPLECNPPPFPPCLSLAACAFVSLRKCCCCISLHALFVGRHHFCIFIPYLPARHAIASSFKKICRQLFNYEIFKAHFVFLGRLRCVVAVVNTCNCVLVGRTFSVLNRSPVVRPLAGIFKELEIRSL